MGVRVVDAKQLDLFPDDSKSVRLQDLPYFDKPINDNQILLNLQHDILVNGSKSAEDELWHRCIILAKKFIYKELGLGVRYLQPEDVEDRALDAVIFVLRRYKDGSGWICKKDYPTQIYGGVKFALYFKTESQKLYENAVHLCITEGLGFEDALIVCREELDQRTERKKGKKLQRTKHREFEALQLSLF